MALGIWYEASVLTLFSIQGISVKRRVSSRPWLQKENLCPAESQGSYLWSRQFHICEHEPSNVRVKLHLTWLLPLKKDLILGGLFVYQR